MSKVQQNSRLKTDRKLHHRFWLGSALALLSAGTFSLNLVLAGMSYQYGANIHALNLARASTFLAVLLLVVVGRRSGLALPGRIRLLSGIVGVLLCAEMYVLLGAIQTIPVALAVLIFYTYPILIALYDWLRGTDRFSVLSLLFLVLAFGGLVIVLIDAPLSLGMTGIGFSIAAALIMAAMLITSEYSLDGYDNFIVLSHSLAVVTLIIVIASLTLVETRWPVNEIGWIIFAGSTLFYVVATFCLFKAVNLIGPLKTAIIDNTAPVWAIIFGYLLLQQSLSPQQIAGAFVVISAVMLLQWSNR